MKKVFYLFLIPLTLLGCEVEMTKENLQGKWEIISYEATNPNFPYLTDAVKQSFLSNVFVLNPDNSYEIIADGKTYEKGSWEITADKEFIFTSADTDKSKYFISKLTKNTMWLVDSQRFAGTQIAIRLTRKND